MDYKFDIREINSQKILEWYLFGTISEDSRFEIIEKALKEMHINNISKTIWDVRGTILDFGLFTSHQIIKNMSSCGMVKTDYIAIIFRNNVGNYSHARNVAHNRGYTNIQFFIDFNKGLSWLLSKK